MCGICGFIGRGSFDDLKIMNDSMYHRGPDDEGFWFDKENSIYLGQRRLSIVDLSGGHQPMWTSDNQLGIVFNGEIYNHQIFRDELIKKGYVFQTDHSDTETLLYCYREWGETFVDKLNGMWAFAIYDKRNSKMFFSRDRFGKKPLFYTVQNNTFAFSSELSSLIRHSNIQSNISKKSLQKYFAYGYIPAPNSLYENIYKLPGGFNLTLDISTLKYRIDKYWDFKLDPFDKIPANPEEVWGEELRTLLSKATKARLMSDVPLGVFLSGGIDSSAITAFASEYVEQGQLKTFSIGFNEASFDESLYAKRVAEIFKTEHYSETLSMDLSRELIPDIMGKLDEPMGDSSIIPTYLLSKITRKNVTVALGGDGGDELFAGYDPFKALRKAEVYKTFFPKPLHIAVRLLFNALPTSHSNMSLDFKIKRTLRGLTYNKKLWNSVWMGPLEPKELNELFGEKIDINELYSEAIEYWDNCKQKNIIDRTLQFYTKLYLQDDILVKADRASMMNSLEVRAPFLDIDLVNFIRRIPNSYKFRNNTTKYILKKALEKVLPDDILYRKKKGFGVPVGKWFKENNLISIKENLFLNTEMVKKLYNNHKAGKEDNRLFLWNYLTLGYFLK